MRKTELHSPSEEKNASLHIEALILEKAGTLHLLAVSNSQPPDKREAALQSATKLMADYQAFRLEFCPA